MRPQQVGARASLHCLVGVSHDVKGTAQQTQPILALHTAVQRGNAAIINTACYNVQN
jgi:hypothetical protein